MRNKTKTKTKPQSVGCRLWKEFQNREREKAKIRKIVKLAKTRTCTNITECYKTRKLNYLRRSEKKFTRRKKAPTGDNL